MTSKRILACISAAAALAACESGDINLQPTNIDNSTTTGAGGGGATNPCASYTAGSTTRQGSFDGTNCTYSSSFVSETNPLTVTVQIPLISGVHVFQDSLFVGQGVSSGPAPAGAILARTTGELPLPLQRFGSTNGVASNDFKPGPTIEFPYYGGHIELY